MPLPKTRLSIHLDSITNPLSVRLAQEDKDAPPHHQKTATPAVLESPETSSPRQPATKEGIGAGIST